MIETNRLDGYSGKNGGLLNPDAIGTRQIRRELQNQICDLAINCGFIDYLVEIGRMDPTEIRCPKTIMEACQRRIANKFPDIVPNSINHEKFKLETKRPIDNEESEIIFGESARDWEID